jgi:threonine dehydrogenase-like Zn-dependent dehydrogenase
MKALKFDGELKLVQDAPVIKEEGEALVEVLCAGICNTDLEIAKGYAGFQGILGHEFVGRVVESPDKKMLGQRVVGEINVGCGNCDLCRTEDARHCPNRTVIGIKNRNGAFAEFLSLPIRNLLAVPDSLSNEEAVFIEPFAAACQILEQIELSHSTNVAVLGDGKLAQLIVRAVALTGCKLTVIGKHESKLALMQNIVSDFFLDEGRENLVAEVFRRNSAAPFDVVIEATGSEKGLPLAVSLVKPKGSIVLKSTHHQLTAFDMSPIVVKEIKIIGSRCGRFQRAIEVLTKEKIDLKSLITAKFDLDDGLNALAKAVEANMLKVIIDMQ